jgi:hypothetical protein
MYGFTPTPLRPSRTLAPARSALVPPSGAYTTRPLERSLKPIGPPAEPGETAVTLRQGHLYAIGLALPLPFSLLPASQLASMGGDVTARFGGSLACKRCGLFSEADSPYRRSGGGGVSHVALVEYTAADRTVTPRDDPSGVVAWIDDVTNKLFPTTVMGDPVSSAMPWVIGGIMLAGLVGIVYFAGDL